MTHDPTTHRRRFAVLACAVALLAACGESDAPVADPDQPVPTAAPRIVDYAGPTSVLSPEIPESFAGAIGPMDVTGAALPPLDTDDPTADPAVGSPSPVVVGVDFGGVPLRIDAAQDGPTMVVFLAHWCPHCNAEIPVFNQLRNEGRFPADLNIVAVSTNPAPDRPNFPPGEWLVEKNWTYPAMPDGVDMDAGGVFISAEAFGVNAFPFVVLVDGDGNIAARFSGEKTADEVESLIESSLGL